MAHAAAKRLILDVDPGHDDAVAMLLALNWPGVEVPGIVATAGNQTLQRTARNARQVVALAGSNVPVSLGRDRPLLADLVTSEKVHGESGLEGIELEELGPVHQLSGADFLVETIRGSREPVTLVATGPLTNVAIAFLRAPDIAKRLERLVIMGGALDAGNVTPVSEFNFRTDPEAAKLVLEAGANATVIGLNVTHQALVIPPEVQAIKELGSPQARAVASWLEFYGDAYRKWYDWEGVPVHDACAVLEALHPGLVTTAPLPVTVETGGQLSRGQLVADRRPAVDPPKPNAQVAVGIDRQEFMKLLMYGLERY